MNEPVKINSFEFENVKRIKAVQLDVEQNGLTVIGGRNGQGKTSILDAIAWTLGGNSKKPSNAEREGSALPPDLHVELSNGIVVERKGKNSNLKVKDKTGKKAGQTLLKEFISDLALDLPKFLNSTAKEKANTLLHTIGIENELQQIDANLKILENERWAKGRELRGKKAYVNECEWFDGLPEEEIDVDDLLTQQQDIMNHNAENDRKRAQVAVKLEQLQDKKEALANSKDYIKNLEEQLERAKEAASALEDEVQTLSTTYTQAKEAADALQDISLAEVKEQLQDVQSTNAQIRINRLKIKAQQQAAQCLEEYSHLDYQIHKMREDRLNLLNGAELPLEDLSIDADGELTYKGHVWDCMSGSEQLKVATAIVRATKPACGFVLVDKLEQMDTQTLSEFATWAQSQGLQVIGTRVATDDSCTIVIEDGHVQGQELQLPKEEKRQADTQEMLDKCAANWGDTF